jgi:hypothetical protein
VTHDPTGPVRKPALDDETDGLDCFAIEAVNEIETADDAPAAFAESHVALPAAGAGVPDVWRRRMRDFALVCTVLIVMSVLAATALKFQSVTSPAGSVSEGTAAPVEPTRPPVTVPSTAATTRPIARPGNEQAPAIDSRVAAPSRPVEVARAVPTRPPLSRPAAREESAPVVEPAAAVPPEPSLSAANERPIVAAPADVRSEPAAETPRALAAPAVIVPPPSERSSIERVLEAYRDAYDRLDAPSAAVIWPRVDTRALNRAFSTLSEQDVLFDSCDLDIAGAKANARCVGEIRYVRRVGDQAPRVRKMSWSFALERVSDRWQIAQVTAD